MGDIKLAYNLNIEQVQKLVMTPELIQAIKILQYNNQDLETYVQEQVLVNPVLEQNENSSGDDTQDLQANDDGNFDWKEFIRNNQYDDISYKGFSDREDSDDKENSFERYVTRDVTLPEHLMFQFQLAPGSGKCREAGKFIIESLDENGYLPLSPEEIAEATNSTVTTVNEALHIIHGLDPVGVGARDLRECLLIQLDDMGMLTDSMKTLIEDHLEELANNRINAVAQEMGMDTLEIQSMADAIRTLEPKPGRQFASEAETKYIIPDVIVEKIDGEYVVTMNESNLPSLRVSPYYKGLLGQADKDSQLAEYLSGRVNSAVWLIKSIQQRQQTIFNVVSSIIRHQKDFFDFGNKYLKTLTLKDVAEELGIHESTVSRTVNGKYLQCDRGMYELRYFFSAGVSDASGEGISSTSIKEFIREIISREDHKKPYSDQKLMEMLNNKGFNISRRTVAKYRDELGILSSSKRKRY